MKVLGTTLREKLDAGDLALGVGVRFARTTDIAKMMKVCGWDWLWPDMEHGALSIDYVTQLASIGLDAGIPTLVRVPPGDLNTAARALDGGAVGIVMPHVDTPEQAAAMVDRLKFPPQGHRSITGNAAQVSYGTGGTTGLAENARLLNGLTFLVAMLESPQALENAGAIAAIDGIDALMIGSNDLAAELGVPGELGHPLMDKAYQTVVEACQKHGKYAGMAGCYQPDLLEKYIGMGVRLVVGGGDSWFMMEAARAKSAELSALRPVKK
jgi:4-hydroxy-2-oxoheptanedioate aldolase